MLDAQRLVRHGFENLLPPFVKQAFDQYLFHALILHKQFGNLLSGCLANLAEPQQPFKA
jgi:hypothetical protein